MEKKTHFDKIELIKPALTYKATESSPVEYYPFNPTFETSDVVKKAIVDPEDENLDYVDENEQKMILQMIENSKISTHQTLSPSKPHLNTFKKPVLKTPNIENPVPKLPILSVPKMEIISSKATPKGKFCTTEAEETPETVTATPVSELEDIESIPTFEQGNLKTSSSNESTNNLSQSLPNKSKGKLPMYDAEFFDKEITVTTVKENIKVVELSHAVENAPPAEAKKNTPFDFAALDDMGDILDCDLNGDLAEEEYLNSLVKPKRDQPEVKSPKIEGNLPGIPQC